MKKIEFKTSKGEFFLVDLKGEGNTETICTMTDLGYCIINAFILITEQQASDIVDSRFIFQTQYIKDMLHCYLDYENNDWVYKEALPSLHSLLKSKCIYLYENPIEVPTHKGNNISEMSEAIKEEQNTFYNPYIFKKL